MMAADEASTRRVGTTLKDKWVLEQLLGVGGMASVYLARHKIGRREAIKILHHEVAGSEQLRARFEQEARAVNSLRHPGVVEVRDIDVTEDGAPFLVMEYLEGESLSLRMKRGPPLALEQVLQIGIETLDALSAVHAHGIIHRDIKPDNLFLTNEGKIKVLDFGIARVRSGGERNMATQAGVTLGTMAYMPPEQARGLEIDVRADIFAVGATIFRLIGSKIIHDASTDAELVMKAMTDRARSLASVAPNTPPGVCAVVDRALAFDRAHRYPDAATMRGDLEAAARGEPLPFDSKAPPLPAHVPASEMFGGRESFAENDAKSPTRNAPTVAPRAKAASPSPPPSTPNIVITPSERGVVVQATTAGVAPEVAATRHTAVAVPSAAVASNRHVEPTIVSRGSSPDAASPTVAAASPAVPSTSDGKLPLIYMLIAAAVLFAFMGAVAAILLTRACFSSSDAPAATSAEPAPVAAPEPSSKWAPPGQQKKKKK